MKDFRAILAELTRRKVLRVLWIYLAVFAGFIAWFFTVGPRFFPDLPDSVYTWVAIVGIAIIPLLVYLSWRYDIVPPQLVRDAKDVELQNPALSWARMRHETKDAGYILLSWSDEERGATEKRFFQPVGIGREPNNDVELEDQRVSRHHAVLWAEDGAWHVRDLDSANGTFIGHSRVTGTAKLPQSCDLRFHPNGPIVSVYVAKSAQTLVGG